VTSAADVPSICERQLHNLVERHGFSLPETERIGRETYVRFHRGDRTVSVAWEPGAAPVVELFEPPQSLADHVVPWAARNGVARTHASLSAHPPNDHVQP
jgi:hypothetical protein